LTNYSEIIQSVGNINNLENQIDDLQKEKEFTMSQEKLDHLDEQIFELEDTIKKLKGK
jgi:polyhydroxyalkanoate synthesis regulator phasin|tara:strand:- start:94 stop:267 length:174 start_codon:yes stop_codon:yes gene_type:complete